MKIYQFIVLLGLVIYTNSTCLAGLVESKRVCHEAPLSSAEKTLGGKYCCYVAYKKGDSKITACMTATQSQYDDIESFMYDLKQKGYNNLSVDCKSHYIEFGLLGLLLLLL